MMPSFGYWFTGPALAAFITFGGSICLLGYGWYRAAVTEMESATSKRGQTKVVSDLAGFVDAGGPLLSRLMNPLDIPAAAEATAWNETVRNYVAANLGPAFSARLNSGAGLSGFVQQAPEHVRDLHRATYVRLIRLQEFLKEGPLPLATPKKPD